MVERRRDHIGDLMHISRYCPFKMQVGAALPVLLCCLGQALGQAVPGIEAWQAAIQAHAQAGHHVHARTKEAHWTDQRRHGSARAVTRSAGMIWMTTVVGIRSLCVCHSLMTLKPVRHYFFFFCNSVRIHAPVMQAEGRVASQSEGGSGAIPGKVTHTFCHSQYYPLVKETV